MKSRDKIDFITLSPLLLLSLLLATSSVKGLITGLVAYPDIATYKYFSIPLIGCSLGLVVFLGVLRKKWIIPLTISQFLRNKTKGICITATVVFTLFFSFILVLRYTGFHTSVIELGSYDNKIWRISSALPFPKSFVIAATGHFQPILILHALFYNISATPIILLILQVITVASGVIPLYLIVKQILKDPLWILLIVVLYLLYPPVEFNSIADFHADHFYIPLSLWAFYFAHQGKYWMSVIMIGIGALAKEPLLLGASFFGIYLVVAMRCYLPGLSSAVFFSLLFLVVIFYIHPAINPCLKEQQINSILEGECFSHLNKFATNSSVFFAGILTGSERKLLFLFSVLSPFLFLPLLSWKEFLPAIPLLVIPILSSSPEHSNIESQYTAGLIAPVFVALIYSLEKINLMFGERHLNAVLALITILLITFHISKSPSPLSMNFWDPRWSETWNYNVYKRGDHEKTLEYILSHIPQDPDKIIVTQSNVNNSRLAHRHTYTFFPRKWEDADYIVLDTKKPLVIGDRVDVKTYNEALRKVENSQTFTLELNRDGILLYKRLK